MNEILNNYLGNSENRWFTTNTTNHYSDTYIRWVDNYVNPRATFNTTANDGWWVRTAYNSHASPEPEKFLSDNLDKILEVKPE